METSRKGVYVCGAFQEPKDIPYSVMEASAAACDAKAVLSSARGTLVRERTYPPERDVSSEEPRIGVFVCNCGTNIGGIVDVPAVGAYARTLPGVTYVEENLFTCSQDTQDKMKEAILREGAHRVVVAACTPRTHEELFQETLKDAGLNKYLFEMSNIRNQCSWVHSKERDAATNKSKDLVRMAVARAQLIQPLPQPTVPVDSRALVIGGGIAGMSAALGLADQGFHVFLVEQSTELGGNALGLSRTWRGDDIARNVQEMASRVEAHAEIEIFKESRVTGTSGFVGNFETVISQNGSDTSIRHGAVIVATGAQEYTPSEYLYGKDSRVLTHQDLDAAIRAGDTRIAGAKSAVFIQCVGSREPGRPYCSKVCCTHTMTSALELKALNPELDVFVLYRDIRTYGQREALYREARRRGVIFIRYSLDRKPAVEADGDAISVSVRDPILDRQILLHPDLVILASAIVPRDNTELAQMFKLSLNEDGFFMEAHAKLRPVGICHRGYFRGRNGPLSEADRREHCPGQGLGIQGLGGPVQKGTHGGGRGLPRERVLLSRVRALRGGLSFWGHIAGGRVGGRKGFPGPGGPSARGAGPVLWPAPQGRRPSSTTMTEKCSPWWRRLWIDDGRLTIQTEQFSPISVYD